MKITLDNVKTLDQLKDIIATKHPDVKMCNGYLSLKYQGVKLTIEPKKDGVYDINRDVPMFKGFLLAVVVICAVYGIAALIYPPALARPQLLVFVGAFIFITIAGIFYQKAKPAIVSICQELEETNTKVSLIKEKAALKKIDAYEAHSELSKIFPAYKDVLYGDNSVICKKASFLMINDELVAFDEVKDVSVDEEKYYYDKYGDVVADADEDDYVVIYDDQYDYCDTTYKVTIDYEHEGRKKRVRLQLSDEKMAWAIRCI